MATFPQKLTFWKAFRFALYKTNPERLKPYFEPEKDLPLVAKSYEHSFFFIWAGPFLALFFGWLNGPGLHGGPIPPEVPTFEVTGYITRPAIARNPDYTIHTGDGRDITIANSDFPSRPLLPYVSKENETPKQDLVFEGFFLKNGEGTFFPLVVNDLSGKVLNKPEWAMENLVNRQEISWPAVYLTAATGWLIHIVMQLFCAFGFLRRNRRYIKNCSLHSLPSQSAP